MMYRLPTTRHLSAAACLLLVSCILLQIFTSCSDKKPIGDDMGQEANLYTIMSVNHRPISVTQTEKGGVTEDPQICDSLLESQSYLNKSEFRIQLIAATPGSGSDWCKTTISLLTGLKTCEVFDFMHEKNSDAIFKDGKFPIYYKSHYPYIKSHSRAGDGYLHENAERVAVVIRNPLDAAISEYIRQRMEWRRGRNPVKYDHVENLITEEDLLEQTAEGTVPSVKFERFLAMYLELWRKHHEYWLVEYKGELLVVLYEDLVRGVDMFLVITRFFGYDNRKGKERLKRYYCFLDNLKKTRQKQRPKVPLIEKSKKRLRALTSERVEGIVSLVKTLYFDKYDKILDLN